MSSATLTSPPAPTARLVVDTDVASLIFKWHPEFAPHYIAIVRRSELVVSFMTLAGMRQSALDANWGARKCDVLEPIWQNQCYTPTAFCAPSGYVRNESARGGH